MSALRSIAGAGAAFVVALLLYLFLWPVPIDPVSWDAPVDTGLVDPFDPNNRLVRARLIDLGTHEGPEDIVGGPDGYIYTATNDGNILRFDQNGNNIEVFADAGGRPLGLEFDADGNLLVANAYLGLQRVTPDGNVEVLTDSVAGQPIEYADDVAVAKNGMIYFSDASSKFGPGAWGGSLAASVLDVMEHGGHGRVLRFDTATGETTVMLDGLNFANGVAISEDQQFLMINESGSYQVSRLWLAGPNAGEREVVIDNLPGIPDNINNGLNGRFWVGFFAPRSKQLDDMSAKPWLRKLTLRLPESFRPKAELSSHVIAITGDGEVLMDLQDTDARLPALTGVYETQDALWLSTLFGNRAGRLDKKDLAN
jgi:sugar lactone lactonase YvrE